ncbi:DUF3105 domain-containing protein [Cryobacterium zhongshanensis]|uniref:DUF3105 domain-containing protein n=1 Tax=Cryobacterium zhongshanensis TaxID=2928153 RepID=A0AA41QWG3_9MICO|nr:DUF3105 domain-containing protein [Cryobacterium zhongshanensis]MCI4658452.1 DUF3105 domain-containing protein [Cryobacterium zhongshanensis]
MARETPPHLDDHSEGGGHESAPATVKQQRAERRAEKVAILKREQSKAKRNRKIGIAAAWSAAGIVVLVIVLVVTTTGAPKNAAAPTSVDGVQTFPNQTSQHVTGTVKYNPLPPVGGDHSVTLLNCGVYSENVPNENAVHSLEHGAVWVTYDASKVTGGQLAALRKEIPSTYAILSPFAGLPSSIVASAWGTQLDISDPADPRLAAFIAKYRGAATAPEPGSPCTGGLDGPGKVS